MTDMVAQIRIVGKNEASDALKKFERDAKMAATNAQKRFEMLSGAMKKSGMALSALGAAGGALIAKTTLLAARVETLGIVMRQVGTTAGYTTEELNRFEEGVRKQGITTQVARTNIIRLIQANIDLEHATKLARISQDAAVIAGINSSEAFQRMVWAINTLRPQVLKQMGLTVSLNEAYKNYAEKLGVAVTQLDMQQKKQAMVNEIMIKGEAIQGSYEAAMETAGKKMTSLARHMEEAARSVGEAFLPAFAALIDAVTAAFKWFNALNPEVKRMTSYSLAAGTAISMMVGPMLIIGSQLPKMVGGLSTVGSAFFSLSTNVAALATKAGFATTALAGLPPALGAVAAAAAGAAVLVAWAAALAMIIKFTVDLSKKKKELRDVIIEHEQQVRKTSKGYAEYAAEMERTKGVVESSIWTRGQLVDTEENLARRLREGTITQKQYEQAVRIVSEAEYKAVMAAQDLSFAHEEQRLAMLSSAQAVAEQANEVDALAESMDDFYKNQLEVLNTTMRGELGQTVMDFTDQMRELKHEYAENNEKIKELESRTWLSEEQRNQLEELKRRQGEIAGEIDRVKAAHVEQTKQIIFDMVAQRMAMMDLPLDQQLQFLGTLAERWGLVDSTTRETMEGVASAISTFMAEGVDAAIGELNELEAKLNGLPTSKRIRILVEQRWGAAPPITSEGTRGGRGVPEQAQHGGPLRGWTLVGEQGQELISPWGYVFDANTTRKMLSAGIRPGKRLALAGYITDGGGGGTLEDDGGGIIDKSKYKSATTKGSIWNLPKLEGGETTTVTTTSVVTEVAKATSQMAEKVSKETAAAIGQALSAMGIELKESQAAQAMETRRAILAQERSNRRVVQVLNEIAEVLRAQGTAFDMAKAVTEGIQTLDV